MIARTDDPRTGSSIGPPDAARLSVSARDVPLSDLVGSEAGLRLLRRLADQVATAARGFERTMETAARSEARASAASLRLQERLRLGARMLHAQQCQIERLERLVADLQAARAAAQETLGRLDQERRSETADAP